MEKGGSSHPLIHSSKKTESHKTRSKRVELKNVFGSIQNRLKEVRNAIQSLQGQEGISGVKDREQELQRNEESLWRQKSRIIHPDVTNEENEELTRIPYEGEIKEALFSMGFLKAPRPDDMPCLFLSIIIIYLDTRLFMQYKFSSK